MTGDAVPQERQAAASRAVSCWSRPYSDNNTEDFVTPSTFASTGPLDIRKGRSGSDLSQQRSRAATGRDGIARGAWGSAVILISSPSCRDWRRPVSLPVIGVDLCGGGEMTGDAVPQERQAAGRAAASSRPTR